MKAQIQCILEVSEMGSMPVWLSTTLLGLGTVFVGLICLIFISKLMSALIGRKKDAPAPKAAPAAAPAPAAQPASDHGAFVAAVSAAIATTMGADVSGLRILSIKKVD